MKARKLPAFERLMIFAGLASLSLLFYRCIFSESLQYTYLIWNLLIAFIPYLVSKKLVTVKQNPAASYILLFSWLISFPACIYPITDLFQLRNTGGISFIYNAMMLLSFAITSLLPGLLSLRNIEIFLKRHTPGLFTKISMVAFIFISSYSACLVRFIHLKDWNVAFDFKRMFYASKHSILYPQDHFRIWIAIILIVMLVDVLYSGIKKITMKHLTIKH